MNMRLFKEKNTQSQTAWLLNYYFFCFSATYSKRMIVDVRLIPELFHFSVLSFLLIQLNWVYCSHAYTYIQIQLLSKKIPQCNELLFN